MKKKKDEETIINLFNSFKVLILEKSSQDDRYSRVVDILNRGIERVTKGSQTPQMEARSVFQNTCTMCLVDKIKLNEEEANALKEIDHFSHSKGTWGEINTFSISNLWPSN